MPDDAELRDLLEKAYGRHSSLSEADAARLRELQEPSAKSPESSPEPQAAPAESGTTLGESGRDDDVVAFDVDTIPSVGRGAEEPSPSDASAAETILEADHAPAAAAHGIKGALRGHGKVVAVASILLVVLGIAVGWVLSGGATPGVALTAAQQERKLELQIGYDEGSLRMIGQDDEAVVWFGTRQDGTFECVILDVGAKSASSCQRADAVDTNMYNNGAAVMTGEGADTTQTMATAVRSTSGEVVAFIQRWTTGPSDWLSQFQGEEADRAEELLAEGYEEYSFWIVGYFRGAPVWSAERFDGQTNQLCLIVDAVDEVACRPSEEARVDGIAVGGLTTDSSGAVTEQWRVKLGYTSTGSAYLTIVGDSEAAVDARDSVESYLELGGEHGDPIRVEVPSDDPAG